MLEAQELLLQMRVVSFPNMKENDRNRWHREMHRLAYPKTHQEEVLSGDALAERLKEILNG